MKRLWLLTVCAGFGLTSAFAADPYVLASGSETLTGEGLNFSKLEVNGALTLAEGAKLYVTNSTETSLIGNGVGVTATLALERNAECRLSGGKDNYLLNIGVLGGDARISIAEGAFFETTGSRFCMSRNTDDQRDLASYSEMNISGTARITYLEMNGYFPVFDSGVTYDATTFPVRSRINVLSGGVLELAGTLQVNDQAMAVISLQNGTLRYGALMTTLSGGGAVRYEIPEGFEGTIDTGAFNAALTYNATPHFAFFSGSGTLRKRGVGSLSCKLLPACNTFTGPIIVEEGTFSLGRPLAEDQTVHVASGAKFIPASEEDLAKVTWVDGAPERSVYVVTGAVLDGIDLLGMSILYFDNTLACSAGLDGSVIGTVTHADATREDPFSITQLGNKTLTLTDTGLEDIPIHFSGAGATLFGGDYIWGAGRDGDWLVDAGSTVGQSGAFMVAGEGPATFTFTQGTFRVSKDLHAGWDGASGTITVSGGQVEVNGELVVGGNPSDHRYQLQGEVHISNATVNAAATHMAPNTDTSGANRTTRYNAVYLHEGGHLHTRYIHRNDDPLSSVIFDGGKLSVMRTSDGKYDSRSMFVSYQNGMLTAEALPDRDIWLEVSPVHNAYMSLIGSGNVKVTLQGEGGFRKEGIGHLLMNKVGTTVVDYHGDTKLNYGITRIGYADVIPHGEGYGDLVIGQHAAVDLYGYPLTVNRLVGLGGIGNGRTDRGADFSSLRVLNIDGDWSFARALPAATLIKDDPNTLTLPGSVPDSLRVKAGAVALPPVAYRHYRFKVENTFGADANSMQIAEFKLLDGETDVTGARSGFSWSTENPSNAARLYPDNEAPGKAVDGDLTTKYLDFRARPLSSDADRDNVWLQFDFEQPQQVTHYNWATANDKAGLNETDNRNPSSWRILGSDDGETWTDLSIYGAYSGTNSLRSWTEPLGFPLTGTRHGFLKVEAGASVTIDRPFYLDYLDNAGTVTLGDAGSIVCGQGDAPGLLCGTLEGTGGLTKIGEGRVAVAVPNSYAGPTRVKGGTLAFQTRAEGEWEWFRFTVKKNHSQSIMQL